MYKQNPIHATAEIIWFKPKKSGNIFHQINISSYAANARHKESRETEIFSLILYFDQETLLNKENSLIAYLHFFAPQIVMPSLFIGAELFITEGPKIVGEAKIISINPLW